MGYALLARKTSEDFHHAPNVTLTRRNIDNFQQSRIQEGKATATADEVVKAFIHHPQQRHYNRAYNLMNRKVAA